MNSCPACCGPAVLLGGLGTTLHFRCRDCGQSFHTLRKTRKPRKPKAVLPK